MTNKKNAFILFAKAMIRGYKAWAVAIIATILAFVAARVWDNELTFGVAWVLFSPTAITAIYIFSTALLIFRYGSIKMFVLSIYLTVFYLVGTNTLLRGFTRYGATDFYIIFADAWTAIIIAVSTIMSILIGFKVGAIDKDYSGVDKNIFHLIKQHEIKSRLKRMYNYEIFIQSLKSRLETLAKENMADYKTPLMAILQELGREYILNNKLKAIKNRYDYVLIDCRPSLGLLTINALTAADEVLVPVKADFFSLPAVQEMIHSVKRIKAGCNPRLKYNGFLITMSDKRRNIEDYEDNFTALAESVGTKVYNTQIRQNAAAADVPSYHMSLYDYKPNSLAAVDYLAFVDEFLEYEGGKKNGNE